MTAYEHDNRSPEIEDEHSSGAHDGEQFKMSGWYCGFCEDEIDNAVDNLLGEYFDK